MGGLLVILEFDGGLQLTFEPHQFVVPPIDLGLVLRAFADVLGRSVDTFKKWDEPVPEDFVILRAAEASLGAEFLEGNSAIGTGGAFGLFGASGELQLGLAEGFFVDFFAGPDMGEIFLRAPFAQMQCPAFTVLDFGDMQRGGLGAATTLFHQVSPRDGSPFTRWSDNAPF